MVLSREYCARISRDMYMVCALLMVIGVSSAYFHATLSMLGQLLDELAILWLDLGATALWLPMEYFPAFCGHSRWGHHTHSISFLPPANEVWGKIMFLDVFVYPPGVGSASGCWGGGASGDVCLQGTGGGVYPGNQKSRRYASYWNAFLFRRIFLQVESFLQWIKKLKKYLTTAQTFD